MNPDRTIPPIESVADLAAGLASPLHRPPAPRLPLSRDNPERIGCLTWELIGYEEYRLAWNAAADLRLPGSVMRMACNRVLERTETAVDRYVAEDHAAPLNAYYVRGLNRFLRQWWETWALCFDESEGDDGWFQPIGPPWEEFEYECVLEGWRMQAECNCQACNTLIRQHDTLILAQDMVQEGWFCSLDCAKWHRHQLFTNCPQLSPFLLDPCPLVKPLPKTSMEMLTYWLTLPRMLAHDWNPDPVDVDLWSNVGLRPKAVSKVARLGRTVT